MNIKRLAVITVLLAAVSTTAFARGPLGGCGDGPGRQGRGFFGAGPGFRYPGDRKSITVSGTVLVEKDRIPLVKSGNEEYILLFPWFLLDEVELESAGQITVTGYVDQSPVSGSKQKVLMARTIKIGEKTWDMEQLMKDRRFGYGRFGDCPAYDDEDDDSRIPRRGPGRRRD